jgi:hypothetical protein
MNRSHAHPTLEDAKVQAKRLRAQLAKEGTLISHGQSLELLARQFGHKDWNTLHAAIGNRPARSLVHIGDQVSGTYLGQHFNAEVIGVQVQSAGTRFRITLKLDEAVDVVRFDSFSAFRHRITCTIGRDGKTEQKTSNGEPHMVLDL